MHLSIKVPINAEIIRNMMELTLHVQDHVVHFYQLAALDWVDIISSLKADPAATAALAQKISPQNPNTSPSYFAGVQERIKKFAESGQLGIFANAYWGHPAYKLPPEANLLGVAHYLEALIWQKEIVKIHTIFGGKNPHPNFVVGGMAVALDLQSQTAINQESLNFMQDPHPAGHRFRGPGVRPRSAGHRVVLSRVDQDRRWPGQLHGVRRAAADQHRRREEFPLPAWRHP